MHALIAVDEPRDVEIDPNAGRHVGVVAAQMFFAVEEVDGLAQRRCGQLL
jgi:hypothetical protein